MLVCACWLFLTVPSAGYGAEAVAPTEEAPVMEEESPSVMAMIRDSGPMGWAFMIVLGAFSVYATMVAVERLSATRSHLLLPPQFVEDLERMVVGREAGGNELRSLCAKFDAPPTNILSAGLLRLGRPLPEVEKAMEDAAAREIAELRSRIRPLNVIGNVAPLVGLLGTVVGMIEAFYTASEGGLGGKGEALAQGIYLALLTTAAGLTIAIPSLLIAAFLNSKIDRIFREIDQHLAESLPSFCALEQPALNEFGSSQKDNSDPARLVSAAK